MKMLKGTKQTPDATGQKWRYIKMKKHNRFNDFVWDVDGNGNYTVTHLRSGRSAFVRSHISVDRPFSIPSSGETEFDFWGNVIPRRFSKIDVMDYLENGFSVKPIEFSDLAIILIFKAAKIGNNDERKAFISKISEYYTKKQLTANEHGAIINAIRPFKEV
jgi:hypothetical protein